MYTHMDRLSNVLCVLIQVDKLFFGICSVKSKGGVGGGLEGQMRSTGIFRRVSQLTGHNHPKHQRPTERVNRRVKGINGGLDYYHFSSTFSYEGSQSKGSSQTHSGF